MSDYYLYYRIVQYNIRIDVQFNDKSTYILFVQLLVQKKYRNTPIAVYICEQNTSHNILTCYIIVYFQFKKFDFYEISRKSSYSLLHNISAESTV